MDRHSYRNDREGFSDPQAPSKSRRPSGNGAPAWLKAMLIEQWVDAISPAISTIKDETCAKCNNTTTPHKLRRICSGVIHTCMSCGKTTVQE